jgi:hypothetical protein
MQNPSPEAVQHSDSDASCGRDRSGDGDTVGAVDSCARSAGAAGVAGGLCAPLHGLTPPAANCGSRSQYRNRIEQETRAFVKRTNQGICIGAGWIGLMEPADLWLLDEDPGGAMGLLLRGTRSADRRARQDRFRRCAHRDGAGGRYLHRRALKSHLSRRRIGVAATPLARQASCWSLHAPTTLPVWMVSATNRFVAPCRT